MKVTLQKHEYDIILVFLKISPSSFLATVVTLATLSSFPSPCVPMLFKRRWEKSPHSLIENNLALTDTF